jgi:hypothetical protein
MTTTPRRQEFTIRGLLELVKQINADPSLVETDWRAPFLDAFELTPSQNVFLSAYPSEKHDKVQRLFHLAAAQIRGGHRVKLRIVSDLDSDSRRYLQLDIPPGGVVELADRTIIDETGSGQGSLTFPIVCCCADCCCWHWCDDSVNPCAGT